MSLCLFPVLGVARAATLFFRVATAVALLAALALDGCSGGGGNQVLPLSQATSRPASSIFCGQNSDVRVRPAFSDCEDPGSCEDLCGDPNPAPPSGPCPAIAGLKPSGAASAAGTAASVCGGTPHGGGPVATTSPAPGAKCDNSPIALGTSNLPGGTNGSATTVDDITSLQNAGSSTYGWFYYTENGNVFFQRNAADTAVSVSGLVGLLKDIPGIEAIADALVDATTSPYQLTLDQANTISTNLNSSGYHEHECFNSVLS